MASGTPYTNGKNGGMSVITPLIAMISLFASIGVAFWTNAKGDVNFVKAELREDLRRSEERYELQFKLIREDLKLLETKAQHDEFAARLDKTADITRDEINRIRADQVSRSEHIQHWSEQSERMNALNARIKDIVTEQAIVNDGMRKEFGGTWTAGDQMKNLQDQIKQLQQRLDVLRVNVTTSPTGSAGSLAPTH